jgi:acyl carrier protein
LPDYMLPSGFVRLDEMPLNPNGKVDRPKLPRPETVRDVAEQDLTPAQDELEVRLTWIWEKVLGVTPIGAGENFFALGGHSLIAVRLFSEIEKAFGKRLPLATLFQAPTIEQLAQVLRQQGWEPTWSSLVALRPQGSKPPFFCVHAVGGNVLEYHDLARHFAAEQPLYGLQSLGLDGKAAPLTSIEAMAAHYLQEIRHVQPTGPYHLGGRSFGGAPLKWRTNYASKAKKSLCSPCWTPIRWAGTSCYQQTKPDNMQKNFASSESSAIWPI